MDSLPPLVSLWKLEKKVNFICVLGSSLEEGGDQKNFKNGGQVLREVLSFSHFKKKKKNHLFLPSS